MDPFVFHAPTKINFGQGLAATAGDILSDLGAKRIVLITDKQLLKNELILSLIENWQLQNNLFVFSDVLPEANLIAINQVAKLAKSEKSDAIIALGGGSVMDTAKVANIILTMGGEALEHQGMNNLPKRLLPSVAIPTTAGTGAEVSPVAMVKDEKEGKKLFFGSKFLAMDEAILDPELIVSLPAKLTAATGLDAVTHCLESLVVEGTSSTFTDALALSALRMLFTYIPEAYKNGANMEARSQTLVASTMAGMAFSSCGVGIVHALSHAVGGQFNTHHGMTNAVLLPYGMRFNLTFASNRYADIARYLKLSDLSNDHKAANVLIDAVEKLISILELPKNLKNLDIPELDAIKLEQLAALASSDPAMIFNTRQADLEDIVEIYRKAY